MILVDTSVWIDFLRGEDSPQRRALHDCIENDTDIAITGIILTEILQGIADGRGLRTTREYLLEFPVYEPKGIPTYIEAARIFRECKMKGRTVRSTVDCIIAAVCIENNMPVLHKDRDYEAIRGCSDLKVVDTW
jgi:predicted nucleic acid-binding protein